MQQLEKELGPDRAIEIETDDEENEAERVCHDLEYDTESDITGPCRGGLSSDCLDHDASTFWPQSYRYAYCIALFLSLSMFGIVFVASFLIHSDYSNVFHQLNDICMHVCRKTSFLAY